MKKKVVQAFGCFCTWLVKLFSIVVLRTISSSLDTPFFYAYSSYSDFWMGHAHTHTHTVLLTINFQHWFQHYAFFKIQNQHSDCSFLLPPSSHSVGRHLIGSCLFPESFPDLTGPDPEICWDLKIRNSLIYNHLPVSLGPVESSTSVSNDKLSVSSSV